MRSGSGRADVLDAQPIIPWWLGTTRWMKKPYVKGMYPKPLTLHSWKWVYIERDPAKKKMGLWSSEYDLSDRLR